MEEKIFSLINENWIKSINGGSNGIGMSFENLLYIEENKKEEPDYGKFELKTSRKKSNYPINLFSSALEGEGEKSFGRLVSAYGYPDKKYGINILNVKVFSIKDTRGNSYYKFRLKINYIEKRIYLLVFNRYGRLLDSSFYWTFTTLRQKLFRKCSRIFLVEADTKYYYGEEYFKYSKGTLYEIKDFIDFLYLIENDVIGVDIVSSAYKKGDREGQLHEHGMYFIINKEDFPKLFDIYKQKTI